MPRILKYPKVIDNKKTKSYRDSFKKHEGGIKSLQWASYKSAANRFKQLVGDFNLEGKTILDVGCGFGDLVPFISNYANNFTYTGVDLLDDFIHEAQKRYPEHSFRELDYFSNPLDEDYDVVFCSGALNSAKDNVKIRKEKIQILFSKTKYALAFNMAGGHGVFNKNKKIYYADSAEILNYCTSLTSKVVFKQHYHKRDFTIIMFK